MDITDIWSGLVTLFCLPGNAMIAACLFVPPLSEFLRLSSESFNSWPAGILSALVWFRLILWIEAAPRRRIRKAARTQRASDRRTAAQEADQSKPLVLRRYPPAYLQGALIAASVGVLAWVAMAS